MLREESIQVAELRCKETLRYAGRQKRAVAYDLLAGEGGEERDDRSVDHLLHLVGDAGKHEHGLPLPAEPEARGRAERVGDHSGAPGDKRLVFRGGGPGEGFVSSSARRCGA